MWPWLARPRPGNIWSRSPPPLSLLLLPWRCDGIFSSLGHAELHHGLGFDLDGFAGLWIATHTGLALSLDQPAKPRDDENAILLCLLHRRLCEQVKKCCRLLVGQLKL